MSILYLYKQIYPPSTAKNCMQCERVGSIGPHTTLLVEFNKKKFLLKIITQNKQKLSNEKRLCKKYER